MFNNRWSKFDGFLAVLCLAAVPGFFALLGYGISGKSVFGAILGGLVGSYALYRYIRMFEE
jgi:hypothetical protein